MISRQRYISGVWVSRPYHICIYPEHGYPGLFVFITFVDILLFYAINLNVICQF